MNLALNQRTQILFLAPHEIVQYTENDHGPRDHDAVVHVLWRRRRCWGPEAPENDKNNVQACEGIVDRAHQAREPPRSPHQARLGNSGVAVVVVGDFVQVDILGR